MISTVVWYNAFTRGPAGESEILEDTVRVIGTT